VLTCQKEVVVLGSSAPHSLSFVQPKNILEYSIKSTSTYLPRYHIPLIILAPMHLLHMHHHLVLSRKATVPSALTATAVAHWAPEYSFLRCMSTIVVAVEVSPATKCLCATPEGCAAENEDSRVGC
jgi:hypothetical protein